MAQLAGHDRSQLLLLPEAVDDYVGPDNPVRFIEAFVDELELAAAGFARVVPNANSSQCGHVRRMSVCTECPPLVQSGGAGGLVVVSGGEAAL
jgi:hypothetical protein